MWSGIYNQFYLQNVMQMTTRDWYKKSEIGLMVKSDCC